MKLKLVISLTGILMLYGFTMKPSTDTTTGKEDNRSWVLGPFVRPEGANPVISPQPTSFYCPMQKQQVKWEESDTFNPCSQHIRYVKSFYRCPVLNYLPPGKVRLFSHLSR